MNVLLQAVAATETCEQKQAYQIILELHWLCLHVYFHMQMHLCLYEVVELWKAKSV